MQQVKIRIEPLGLEVEVDKGTPLKEVLASFGVDFPCAGRGTCGKCRYKLLSGSISLTPAHAQFLDKKGWGAEWRLACYSFVGEDITIHIDQLDDSSILSDNSYFDFVPRRGFGVAVDLGSTTIVSQLVDLESGEVVASRAVMNPQSSYGADIISRISFAMESPENLSLLSQLVRDVIFLHIREFMHIAQSSFEVVIVGNSVMHHLFCGIDPAPLAAYPFESDRNEMVTMSAEELQWDLPCDVQLHFMPNISHFVGSDILAGIIAVGMDRSAKCQILIDLGTNGEIVIGNKERLICTSTAAGPAFEGVNISQGMKAVLGAVYRISATQSGEAECGVIGGAEPKGICGSGLVDAVKYLLQSEQIDATGMIVGDGRSVNICDGVSLTDADIREFQLAKSAIATGIHFILKEFGISISDVDKVYISGGLGTHVNAEHASSVGLITLDNISQLVKARNSALAGAKQLLYSEYRQLVPALLAKSDYCSLEGQVDFQDVYCDHLYFS